MTVFLPVFGTVLVRSVSGPRARQWRGVAPATMLAHFISGTTFPKPSEAGPGLLLGGTLLLYFHFSALPRSENFWQLIAFNRRHPFAKASENLLDLCGRLARCARSSKYSDVRSTETFSASASVIS